MRLVAVGFGCFVALLGWGCSDEPRDRAPLGNPGDSAGGAGGDADGSGGAVDPTTLSACQDFTDKIVETCSATVPDPAVECPQFGGCGADAAALLTCIVDTGDWTCGADDMTWTVTWEACPTKVDCP